MNREVIITGDGSPTLFVPELNEHYHSIHGALNESLHVFIQNGLIHQLTIHQHIHLLEIGLGTASNLLLTINAMNNSPIKVHYEALEPFPIQPGIVAQLTDLYAQQFSTSATLFQSIHQQPANIALQINPQFKFTRIEEKLENAILLPQYNLVYFDAFGPRAQPEMWDKSNFEKIYAAMEQDGTLVTYCAKGEVRRNLQAVGFLVERLPGPPGKREMLRATKK